MVDEVAADVAGGGPDHGGKVAGPVGALEVVGVAPVPGALHLVVPPLHNRLNTQ